MAYYEILNFMKYKRTNKERLLYSTISKIYNKNLILNGL